MEGQSDPADVKIEPLFENRWNCNYFEFVSQTTMWTSGLALWGKVSTQRLPFWTIGIKLIWFCFFCLLLMIDMTNFFLLFTWEKNTILNHSCNNNLSKYFLADVMVVQACKTIKEGEEVWQLRKELWKPIIDMQQLYMRGLYNCWDEIAVKLLVFKVTENYYPTAMMLERKERKEYLETL